MKSSNRLIGAFFVSNWFNAQSEFTNKDGGRYMYSTFGSSYFTRKFSQFGPERYCTEFVSNSVFLRPALTLSRDLTSRMTMAYTMSYSLLSTDEFDAYTFPTWANTRNDAYWSFTLGLQWILRKADVKN